MIVYVLTKREHSPYVGDSVQTIAVTKSEADALAWALRPNTYYVNYDYEEFKLDEIPE